MILLIFIILLLFIILLVKIKINENFNNNNNINIVISRYNENLDWLNEKPFNKYQNIIYNKGINENFVKNDKNISIINLENLGRCDGTYLYHIVNNYNNLSDITIFLPGSINMIDKKKKAIKLINEIEKHQNTVFIGIKYNNVSDDLYNFKLDKWEASNIKNKEINKEILLTPSNIRPFGLWFKDNFLNTKIKYISYWGILGIHKKDILQKPISFYKKLLDEVNISSNTEVGHYIERSWEAIFYKFNNAKYIEYI